MAEYGVSQDLIVIAETRLRNDADQRAVSELVPCDYELDILQVNQKRGGGIDIMYRLGFSVKVI